MTFEIGDLEMQDSHLHTNSILCLTLEMICVMFEVDSSKTFWENFWKSTVCVDGQQGDGQMDAHSAAPNTYPTNICMHCRVGLSAAIVGIMEAKMAT